MELPRHLHAVRYFHDGTRPSLYFPATTWVTLPYMRAITLRQSASELGTLELTALDTPQTRDIGIDAQHRLALILIVWDGDAELGPFKFRDNDHAAILPRAPGQPPLIRWTLTGPHMTLDEIHDFNDRELKRIHDELMPNLVAPYQAGKQSL